MPMNSTALIAIGALLVTTSVAGLIWSVIEARSTSPRRNAKVMPGRRTDLRFMLLHESAARRVVSPALDGLGARARTLTPSGWLDGLDRRLERAALHNRWPVEGILVAKLAGAAVFTAVAAVMLLPQPSPLRVLMVCGALVAGYMTPDYLISRQGNKRQESIRLDLPDVLDQITIGVEAGLGFDQAIQSVAGASEGSPLAEELTRMLRDIQLGTSRVSALRDLGVRNDVDDLSQFSFALIQAERLGVPIAKVLRVQSADIREKRRMRAEEVAHRLPVKMTVPTILCILPALFVMVLGPAFLKFNETGGFGG